MPKFITAAVTLTQDEWEEYCDNLDELARLREEVAEYHRRDLEYFQWSMDFPARMNDALQLAQLIDKN